MPTRDTSLRDELKMAGAQAAEVRDLLGVAQSLSRLKGTEPARSARYVRHKRSAVRVMWPVLMTLSLGMAAALLIVVWSQASYPGSSLYSVKRMSERFISQVIPGYGTVIMMHRAQEVGALVAHKQSDHLITGALAEYKTDMLGLKTKNYQAQEYCHSQLTQAETKADPTEKQQIAAVLSSLGRDND